MKLFCWIFGHRFVTVSDPVGNSKTVWHVTAMCTRCADTKRIELRIEV